MEQKGRKILASGNVLIWTLRETGSRGAAYGVFSSDPSEADAVEAMAFIESFHPSDGQTVIPTSLSNTGVQAVRNLLDSFLDGGSRN